MSCPDAIRAALTGPVASLSTLFAENGAVHEAAMRQLIDVVIANGSKSVILTYGDSLFSLLTDDEVVALTRLVVDHVAGRALVVAADRMWAAPRELEFARFCREAGVGVLMVLPPDWAVSCTHESLVEHYAAVAHEIPVMLVTNYLAQHPLPQAMDLLESLRDHVPGVVAVKDDVCGEFARRLGLAVAGDMAVISGGQKQNHLNAAPYGCDGYLSTFIRFKPEIAHAYWKAFTAHDWPAATRIIRDVDMPFFDFIATLPGGFDAGIHGTLEIFGVAKRWRRKPYHSLTDEEMERLRSFFKGIGLL